MEWNGSFTFFFLFKLFDGANIQKNILLIYHLKDNYTYSYHIYIKKIDLKSKKDMSDLM